jgi:hypothetical protein
MGKKHLSIRQVQAFRKALKDFTYEANDESINNFEKSLRVLIEELDSQDHAPVKFVFEGWCSEKNSIDIDPLELSRANPGFKIRVTRYMRRDLMRHRKALGFLPGYKVYFTRVSKANEVQRISPTFFALKNIDEIVKPIMSNSSSHFREGSVRKYLGKQPKRVSPSDHFYLDRVDTRGSGFWFDFSARALILNNLHEVVDLLRFLENPICSQSLEQFIKSEYGTGTYSNRVSFLNHANSFVPSRGTRVLGIDRKLSTFPISKDQPFVEAKRDGNIVKFRRKLVTLGVPVAKFKKVKKAIVFEGSQVEQNGSLVLVEAAADPTHDFVSGQWQYLWGGPAQVGHVLCTESSKKTLMIQSGALLGGRNDINWYHWIAEYAPRAAFDQNIPKNVPFLVSDRVPEYFLEVIREVSNRPIKRLPHGKKWAVEELYVSQPPLQILDSPRIPFDEGISANFEQLSIYREKLIGKVKEKEFPKKIFLMRDSSHRGVKNQNQLEKIAKSLGLSSIDPSKLSWPDQASLFKNAEFVVGASGAVMANYLLLPKNASVLALASTNTWDFVEPAYLCMVSGAKFQYLLGQPKKSKSSSLNAIHASFRINPREFRRVVQSLMQSKQ